LLGDLFLLPGAVIAGHFGFLSGANACPRSRELHPFLELLRRRRRNQVLIARPSDQMILTKHYPGLHQVKHQA